MKESNSNNNKDGLTSFIEKLDFSDSNGVDPKIRRRITLLRVGIAFFLITAASLIYNFVGEDYVVVLNQSNQLEVHFLPDSSIVKLESNASIRYKTERYKKQRRIELNGSAYLEIVGGDDFETSLRGISIMTTMGSFEVQSEASLIVIKSVDSKLKVVVGNANKEIGGGEELKVSKAKFLQ